MKLAAVVLLSLLSFSASHAQTRIAVPIEDAEEHGLSMARLDSLHGPVLVDVCTIEATRRAGKNTPCGQPLAVRGV